MARRAGSLSRSGAFAAAVVGAASSAAGWGWAALLVGWFAASSALTRLGAATKAARTAATLPANGPRSAIQVWANGGVFAVAAVLATMLDEPLWGVAAVGALAAAAADTWATEIGTLLGGVPRSIVTGRAVEPGLSGGITLHGTLGGAAGAAAVAVPGTFLVGGEFSMLWPLVAAGMLGGVGDSLLGATLQAKRYCPRCARWTERATHDCGVATEPGRGWPWMTNDTVNLLATLIGAAAAAWLLAPSLPAVP